MYTFFRHSYIQVRNSLRCIRFVFCSGGVDLYNSALEYCRMIQFFNLVYSFNVTRVSKILSGLNDFVTMAQALMLGVGRFWKFWKL